MKLLYFVAVTLLLLGNIFNVSATEHPVQSLSPLVKKISPAVVSIAVNTTVVINEEQQDGPQTRLPPDSPLHKFFPKKEKRAEKLEKKHTGSGSGFIIDPQGIIVTNNHVIRNAEIVEVTLHNGEKLNASIVGFDELSDIAVLKIKPETALPTVTFGNSDVVEVGDWTIAIGNPFGIGKSVTVGIISAKDRSTTENKVITYLQTDASINPGNSGGPLFNLDGKVIGINTIITSTSGGSLGIGFAIPSKFVKIVVNELNMYGKIRKRPLGAEVSELKEEMGAEIKKWIKINAIMPHGPASEAGMREGDVLLFLDDKAIETIIDLKTALMLSDVGSVVKMKVRRENKIVELVMTIKVQE